MKEERIFFASSSSSWSLTWTKRNTSLLVFHTRKNMFVWLCTIEKKEMEKMTSSYQVFIITDNTW